MTAPRVIYLPQLPQVLADIPNDQIPCLSPTDSGSWMSGTLADLAPTEEAQEVDVYLPNLHILGTQVTVPKKQQKHLTQILPFLCEDKLACDLEDVHLAAGQVRDETVPVRAIQRNMLQTVLDKLSEQNIQPQGIYSDAEPLLQLGGTLLWLEPTRCMLIDQQRVINLDPSQVVHITTLLQDPPNAQQLGPEMTVYRHPQLTNTTIHLQLEELRSRGYHISEIPLQLAPTTGNALLPEVTAQNIELTPQRYVNLLTGPYTPVRHKSGKRNWQPLAWVASAMIGLNLLYLLASGVYFDQRADKLQQSSEQLYRQYFPQDRRVVNIRTQTQAHLDKGRQGANEGFLNLLGQLQPGWEQHNSNLQLKSLRYHNQRRELLLDIESKTISLLDQFQQSLGPRAELLSANEDNNNGARGRIKFQGAL